MLWCGYYVPRQKKQKQKKPQPFGYLKELFHFQGLIIPFQEKILGNRHPLQAFLESTTWTGRRAVPAGSFLDAAVPGILGLCVPGMGDFLCSDQACWMCVQALMNWNLIVKHLHLFGSSRYCRYSPMTMESDTRCQMLDVSPACNSTVLLT